jgi:flagellar hook-length control protein FliK
MQIRLHPVELGTVRLRLVMEEGMLAAKLQVESETVKGMMESSLPSLQAALEERGIQVQAFEVSVDPEGSNAFPREHEEFHRGRFSNAFQQMSRSGQENMEYPDERERHARRHFGYNTMEMTA